MSRLLIIIAAVFFVLYLLRKGPTKQRVAGKRKPRAVPPGSGRSAHDILGVRPGASEDEIRRAYQEKVQQYHPDKVASMAGELQELAEQRTKELNGAYNELMNR